MSGGDIIAAIQQQPVCWEHYEHESHGRVDRPIVKILDHSICIWIVSRRAIVYAVEVICAVKRCYHIHHRWMAVRAYAVIGCDLANDQVIWMRDRKWSIYVVWYYCGSSYAAPNGSTSQMIHHIDCIDMVFLFDEFACESSYNTVDWMLYRTVCWDEIHNSFIIFMFDYWNIWREIRCLPAFEWLFAGMRPHMCRKILPQFEFMSAYLARMVQCVV